MDWGIDGSGEQGMAGAQTVTHPKAFARSGLAQAHATTTPTTILPLTYPATASAKNLSLEHGGDGIVMTITGSLAKGLPLLIFGGVWSAIALTVTGGFLLGAKHFPLFALIPVAIGLVFDLIGVVMIWSGLSMLTRRERLELNRDGATFTNQSCFGRKTERIPFSDIYSIERSSSHAVNNMAVYHLVIRSATLPPIRLGSTLDTPSVDYALGQLRSWMERNGRPLPEPTYIPLEAGYSKTADGVIVPPGKPPESKIDLKNMSSTEWMIHIPASGKSGGLLVFGIIWTLFCGVFVTAMFSSGMQGQAVQGELILGIGFFVLVGIGMLYAAIRMKYAVHLLYLSPEFVRLQRQLWGGRKNRDAATQSITAVTKEVFYTQNYQPVFGIQIAAGNKKLRFGTGLTEAEKDWLVAEIRDAVRTLGAQV
jgi:hypothetical protein